MSEKIAFGSFILHPDERLLLRQGKPVDLGTRAFDILVTLATQPNEVVSKADLLARVWPDVTVEEGSLRFHMANLRKVLAADAGGARYIATLTGRGYCFVAPMSRPDPHDGARADIAADYPHANLPGHLRRMVGRNDDIAALSAQLMATRFVTIAGMGGVGKTTVAVAVGHKLIEEFAGAVHLVDLGAINDPDLVATNATSTLGLSNPSGDAISSLIAHLTNRRTLLILDTCEHVIDAVAALAARIVSAVPHAHVLATSREPFHVEGEHVYKLSPLACPPGDPIVTVAAAQGYPATRLFIERAEATGARLDLDDAEAAVVTGICRKLDGVPLAIELAAGRVASHGLQKTAALLDERFSLLWPGRRIAPPRQKTLQATLDWSYSLLSDFERVVLRRLAVFAGDFSIDGAVTVVTDNAIDEALVFGAIDSLVAKSMVATTPTGATMRYRLLDTTRAYALQIDMDSSELAGVAARHASYCLRWLEETGLEWPRLVNATQRSRHLAGLANVRAALDWCFGSSGDTDIGIRLAVAADPVFISMSLLTEDRFWTARAIGALDETGRGGRKEMHLQAALGVSLMFTRGGTEAARDALNRSFAIAEQHGDALDKIQILGPLQMFYLRTGEFRTALVYAQRCYDLANMLKDLVSTTLAHSIMGMSLHLAGECDRARTALEAGLRYTPHSDRTTTNYLGFDGRLLAGAILARALWLQGQPDQAVERSLLTIREAEALDHPLTISIALVWTISLFLWLGDLDRASQHINRLFALADLHSLGPYLVVGRGFRGELAIRRGDADSGVRTLQHALTELHKLPYELLTTPLNIALIQGLAETHRFVEAFALLDETMQSVETNGDLCYMPELLRLKGNLVLATAPPHDDTAETYFTQSLELSRRQGARAWELRTAIDFATLLVGRGKHERAEEILKPPFKQFVEGLDAPDLLSAARILEALQ
jgi:predicted ATPase/DNA-binding winged helix-turn-helix (wHTH) protein